MNTTEAFEIVVSAHEAAHAVASVRLGLPFNYVTMEDAEYGPHVRHVENHPRPIAFYTDVNSCCRSSGAICEACRAEEKRAEAYMVIAICGSIGAAVTGGARAFGHGHEADKVYVIEFCRTAFGDRTDAEVERRTKAMLRRAQSMMEQEMKALSAVAKALRTRRRLIEADVRDILGNLSADDVADALSEDSE